jgi:hypothetical protein
VIAKSTQTEFNDKMLDLEKDWTVRVIVGPIRPN